MPSHPPVFYLASYRRSPSRRRNPWPRRLALNGFALLAAALYLFASVHASYWHGRLNPMGTGRAQAAVGAANVYYANCTAARSDGAAPIYAGQPGYRPALDGDGDGIACEPYYGR